MQIRNDFSLPTAVYNVLAKDHYVAGDNDFSVTALLNPPQQTELLRRHRDQLSIDATENWYSLLGTAVHNLMEEYAEKDALTEKRLYIRADTGEEVYTIGGQIDYYFAGTVRDYKVTSVNAYMMGSRFESWENQLNLYAYLLRQNGYPVNRLEICMFFRDWSQFNFKLGYPRAPILIKKFLPR